jgi:1-acyl-sn-glycerol-3-phosphate acyltransferase
VRVVVDDENEPHAPRPAIYLSNHRSNLDVWAIVAAVPDSTRFVAKQSLFRITFLGWAMRAGGFVPVDRANRERAIASLDAAAAHVAQGKSLVMFPEGTRSREGRLGPFKKGPFHVALAARCPIVPVAICGTYELLSPKTWRILPGEIRVRLAPAIETKVGSVKSLDEWMTAVRGAIAERLPESARPAATTAPP